MKFLGDFFPFQYFWWHWANIFFVYPLDPTHLSNSSPPVTSSRTRLISMGVSNISLSFIWGKHIHQERTSTTAHSHLPWRWLKLWTRQYLALAVGWVRSVKIPHAPIRKTLVRPWGPSLSQLLALSVTSGFSKAPFDFDFFFSFWKEKSFKNTSKIYSNVEGFFFFI